MCTCVYLTQTSARKEAEQERSDLAQEKSDLQWRLEEYAKKIKKKQRKVWQAVAVAVAVLKSEHSLNPFRSENWRMRSDISRNTLRMQRR